MNFNYQITIEIKGKTFYYEAAGLFTEKKEEAAILDRAATTQVCDTLKGAMYSNIKATRVA